MDDLTEDLMLRIMSHLEPDRVGIMEQCSSRMQELSQSCWQKWSKTDSHVEVKVKNSYHYHKYRCRAAYIAQLIEQGLQHDDIGAFAAAIDRDSDYANYPDEETVRVDAARTLRKMYKRHMTACTIDTEGLMLVMQVANSSP